MPVYLSSSLVLCIFSWFIVNYTCDAQKMVDTADEFPTYDLILNIMKAADAGVATGWGIIQNVKKYMVYIFCTKLVDSYIIFNATAFKLLTHIYSEALYGRPSKHSVDSN